MQELRATQDAIITGIGTVLADDPQLTVRLPGREQDSPQRIVLDSGLRMPLEAKILPAWIFASTAAAAGKDTKLKEKDSKLFIVPSSQGKLDLSKILNVITKNGVTRLMVEAGGEVAAAFLMAGLVDRIYWYRAPSVIGEKGMPALHEQDLLSLSRSWRYKLAETLRPGNDTLEIYDSVT